MEYQQALDYLLAFSDMERGYQASPNPTMSLESMRSLLRRLDNPQDGRHTVHVTGSKGKGTTAAMVEGILRHSHHRTALYTSPHLHDYTERIRIGDDAVSPGEFATALGALRPVIDAEQAESGGNVSTFGAITALFFWLVRAQVTHIDWQVVEVGLGGTFDATNVFRDIDAAVITPISLEHTAILGSTPAEIAADKAGIIKPGSVCILAPQKDPAVRYVVRERCEQVGAEFVDVSARYEAEPVEHFPFGQSFLLHGPSGTRELRTPMLGRHQLDNAATAVAVADAIAAREAIIPERAIIDGLARTRVPGRVEVMGQSPAVVADGAHNRESAAALAATLRDYFEWDRCLVILGVQKDKDARGIAREFASIADRVYCVPIDNPRSMDVDDLVKAVDFVGPPAMARASLAEALKSALLEASPHDLVCITGSLYLAAQARELVLGESVTPGP